MSGQPWYAVIRLDSLGHPVDRDATFWTEREKAVQHRDELQDPELHAVFMLTPLAETWHWTWGVTTPRTGEVVEQLTESAARKVAEESGGRVVRRRAGWAGWVPG